ncbi:MAG: 4-hydroxythreonine-4-phosphate dehydrogenase PdxA [Candidatus Omnitrophota bacterium]
MRTSRSDKTIAVITAGDPSGIGSEIILRSIKDPSVLSKITPVVVGDYDLFLRTAKTLKIDAGPIRPQDPGGFSIKHSGINFIDVKNVSMKSFRFGVTDAHYGRASIDYLRCGVSIVQSHKSSFLVTAPINKASVNKAGFKFAGHTEYLSEMTGAKRVTMMLIGGPLKVTLVTRHIPLGDVSGAITKDGIVGTARNTYHALKDLFGIKDPVIGVTGVNPHSGEEGHLGSEEKEIIAPAVRQLKGLTKNVFGPEPSDTLFHKAYKGEVDAVVCMYHDQAMIPIKMVAFDVGVNLSIGLPFIRTSPGHGTAFDIAGRGKANPSSMIEAIKLGARLSKPR